MEFTDDESDMPALEFVSSLLARGPGQFGNDPSQLDIVWHSIVGLVERPVATDPHLSVDRPNHRPYLGLQRIEQFDARSAAHHAPRRE